MTHLLSRHADPNTCSSTRRTAIWYCAAVGAVDRVRELYSFGAEIDEPDDLGITPFGAACINDCLEVVEYLFRLSPSLATTNLEITGFESWPPIFVSIQNGSDRVTKFLVTKSGPVYLSYADRAGRNALTLSVDSGNYDLGHLVVKRMLQCGEKDLVKSLLCGEGHGAKNKVNFMWIAAHKGSLRSLDWALATLQRDLGMTPSQIEFYVNLNVSHVTPLVVALVRQNLHVARRLIEVGAFLGSPHGTHSVLEPLAAACSTGNIHAVRLLLHSGCKRNTDRLLAREAFHKGHMQITQYLLDTQGYSSRLHYAAELPEALVLALLRAGGDVHYTEDYGPSPLEVANHEISQGNRSAGFARIREASEPWSVRNHELFDDKARRLAVFIYSYMGYQSHGAVPREIWLEHIIPFTVERLNPPLSWEELNRVWPGDGR